ncbi:hypothetical protein AHF37_11940 [Paragonimus kellicotti]|nr:hypothetical protein AHF37_11940 [Paragonimus kellicotti]
MEMNNIQTGLSTGELEVLLLLQRANLSQYFKSFIDHGGDDARQLVDLLKDPNDFMELVKLVGMDKKPLHVRRLRKVLQDFPNLSDREPSGSSTSETIDNSVSEQVTNPMLFNIPVNAALPLFSPLTRDLSTTISGTSIMVNAVPNTIAQPGLLWSAISPILQRMQANSLIQLLNESHSHASSDWNTSSISCGDNRLQSDGTQVFILGTTKIMSIRSFVLTFSIQNTWMDLVCFTSSLGKFRGDLVQSMASRQNVAKTVSITNEPDLLNVGLVQALAQASHYKPY